MERKLLIVLLLSFFVSTLSAQMIKIQVDTLPFANFKNDTLWIDPDNHTLDHFFKKFDSVVTTKQGNINIVHIGSSHVQAGTLSHRIRRNILHSYPDLISRRGMIFPYSAANKCNNPLDYKVKRSREFSLIRNVYRDHPTPLGLCGIGVFVADSVAQFLITLNDSDLEFMTDRIVLLGQSNSDTNVVIPLIKVDTTYFEPYLIDKQNRRFEYNVSEFTDSFTVVIPCNLTDTFTLTGILLDNCLPGITVHSIGVNGATLTDYLRCPYFVRDLELVKPDLVIFGIGINDAKGGGFDTVAFQSKYIALVDSFKLVNPDCAFIFITNNDSYKRISRGKYTVNKNGLMAREAFYRIAHQTKNAIWDQFAIMGGLKSMDKWRQNKLAQYDRTHFTSRGYNLMGDLFFNAFADAAANALKKE